MADVLGIEQIQAPSLSEGAALAAMWDRSVDLPEHERAIEEAELLFLAKGMPDEEMPVFWDALAQLTAVRERAREQRLADDAALAELAAEEARAAAARQRIAEMTSSWRVALRLSA